MKVTPGREHLTSHLPIHGRGTWIVKAILLNPKFQRIMRMVRAWVIAGLVGAIALKLRRRSLLGGNSKGAAAQDPAKPSRQNAAPTGPQAGAPKRSFWELLKPEDGKLVIAGPEMVVLVMASVTQAWLMLYKAWLMREFVTGQNLGRWRQWFMALAKFPFVTMAVALLSQTTTYMQTRVSLLWREAATRKLMQGYFSSMNYYKLQHHRDMRIEDPDVRMCSDIRSACDALTGIFIGGMSGFTLLTFSTWALYSRRGFSAIILPYLYSFMLVPLNFALTSPDWSIVMLVHKAYSTYQQALMRVQHYSEGVAMLKGQVFEQDVLDRLARNWANAERASWNALARFEWFQHFFSNPTMPGIWQTVASFGASIIAMRAGGPGRPVLDPVEPNEAVVYEYGANISDFWQVYIGVRGASTFMAALENYKRCTSSLYRVEQLQEALAYGMSQDSSSSQSTFTAGEVIAFDDVSVVTPTGVKLMAGLTFKVEPGRHLVICGHNGAGKSSIFRCLGGLWPVPHGKITCPSNGGVGGLHGAAYYLPQRPANILGTLSDQLTYPKRVPGGLPEEDLRRWLSYVKIEYLVDKAWRSGSLDMEADWAVKLSLGEQQRFGIARLLYHRPRFAILDECTSAVSKDMERWLFEVAAELGIACVTITHRPALLEYHHQMLRLTGKLEEDGKGWEVIDLPSRLPPAKPHAESEEEVHGRIRTLLESRDKQNGSLKLVSSDGALYTSPTGPSPGGPYAGNSQASLAMTVGNTLTERVLTRYPTILRRLFAALRLERLGFKVLARFFAILVCMVIRPQASWEVYRTVGGSVALAMTNDGVGLAAELIINLVYGAGLCCLDRSIEALSQRLMLDIWTEIASNLHDEALEDAAFHRAAAPDVGLTVGGANFGLCLENPMQRIGEAKLLLDDVKGQFLATGGLMIQMLYFLPLLLRGGGLLPAGTLILLYLTHSAVRTHWMPNFKELAARQSDFENRFQVAQTRMRHVAEPVAFSGGGDSERERVQEHFKRLCENRLASMHQEFLYNFLTEFFISYDNLPIWFHRMLSFNFAFRNVPIGGASPASAVQNYLYDRTISVSLVGIQALSAFHAELAKIDSRACRLLELREALAVVREEVKSSQCQIADRIVVQGLDLTTPRKEVLAKDISFEVEPGSPLLVTGPNGSGKTGLARVLLGLWSPAGRPGYVAAPRDLMIIPQRPYLAPGTLGDQVTYPRPFMLGVDEERAERALRTVGIFYLLERYAPKGWSHECAWEEVLSGGEQQRLGLSRVLFHRPRFALLDECTSMVAADAEERLYESVMKDNVTPITFSQRLFLPQLYPMELHLGDNGTPTGRSRGWWLGSTAGKS